MKRGRPCSSNLIVRSRWPLSTAGAPCCRRRRQAAAGENDAKERLNTSPRHGEFVDIAVPDMKTPLKSYVVYPEAKEKAPVVIVIHEIFGLTDWIRSVADQLAADGFIAIAPDLISGMGPSGGGTDSVASGDDVRKLVNGFKHDEVVNKLNAVRDYGMKLPAANGKTATIGFCWGGMQSFAYAAAQPELNAAVVYYGTSPDDPAAYAQDQSPRPRPLRLRRRPREQDDRPRQVSHEGQVLHASHLRRRRPRLPPPAGRPGRRQHEGRPAGVAGDGEVHQGAHASKSS